MLEEEEKDTVRMGLMKKSFDFFFTEETAFFIRINDALCDLFPGRPETRDEIVELWSDARGQEVISLDENRRLLEYSLEYLRF